MLRENSYLTYICPRGHTLHRKQFIGDLIRQQHLSLRCFQLLLMTIVVDDNCCWWHLLLITIVVDDNCCWSQLLCYFKLLWSSQSLIQATSIVPDMHPQTSVFTRALQADKHTIGDWHPLWITGATLKTHLQKKEYDHHIRASSWGPCPQTRPFCTVFHSLHCYHVFAWVLRWPVGFLD